MLPYQQPSKCLGGLGLRQTTALLMLIASVLLGQLSAIAQFAPSIGYMFPTGGQAGEIVEVTLGGYDWTPDMQLFVRDERIELKIAGVPGPVLVPEPPYWFGKKARRAPFALPRETKARLTIPAGTSPGVIKWQAANANGGTACGRFTVSDLPIQLDASEQSQTLQTLPFCVSGQIKLIREVDRFQFSSAENCQVRCSLISASIASPLRAILQVRDTTDRLIAEVADTAGADSILTFAASAGQVYSASVYDLDFRGDRSFVYQLTIAPEVPVAVAQVASVAADQTRSLTVPAHVSGTLLKKFGEDRFQVSGQAGELWTIAASGEKTGSQVDPAVTVLDGQGKLLARGDDTPGSTDAVLEFKVPAAGEYEIVVSDLSGSSGSPRATYEMSIHHTVPDFELRTAEKIDVPIGGKVNLELNVVRKGGFTDPINVKFIGLPTGIRAAENLQIPAKKSSLKVELHADARAAATAALASVQAQAVIGEQVIQRSSDSVLVSSTIKPPFSIDAEGQDDVTKWPRGTTFPAPVLIAR
ncbi:MAG: PPC domain-containing protein, partial [Pirellulaceae bacterium]|nr:PPC domain-containing protein [Pirellulaceae bacterium]